jgi:hypothetical protein
MKPSARQRRWSDWAPAFAGEQEGMDTKKGGRTIARPPLFETEGGNAYAPAFFSAAWTSFQVIAP